MLWTCCWEYGIDEQEITESWEILQPCTWENLALNLGQTKLARYAHPNSWGWRGCAFKTWCVWRLSRCLSAYMRRQGMQAGDLSQLCPGLTPTGILQMNLSFYLVSSPCLCYLFFTKVLESHRFAWRSSHEFNSTLSSLNRHLVISWSFSPVATPSIGTGRSIMLQQ